MLVPALRLGALALVTCIFPANAAQDPSFTNQLEELASSLSVVPVGDWLYGRSGGRRSPAADRLEESYATLEKLARQEAALERFTHALQSSDPKIRGLAILGLVATENKRSIPPIHLMLSDEETAFYEPVILATTLPWESPNQHTEAVTVALVAKRALGLFGFFPQSTAPGFETTEAERFGVWSAERLTNDDWIGWPLFKYTRATGGTSPPPPDRHQHISKFRRWLEEQSPALQAYTWLTLASEAMTRPADNPSGMSRDEVISLGRSLGEAALLEFVCTGNRPGLRNPALDAQLAHARFVRENAWEFFTPASTDRLFDCGQFLAAADSGSNRPLPILEAGLAATTARWQNFERAKLFAAYVQHGNSTTDKQVFAWFFDPSHAGDRSLFLQEIRRRRGTASVERFLRTAVNHTNRESLEALDWIYLAVLARETLPDLPLPEGQFYIDDAGKLQKQLLDWFADP